MKLAAGSGMSDSHPKEIPSLFWIILFREMTAGRLPSWTFPERRRHCRTVGTAVRAWRGRRMVRKSGSQETIGIDRALYAVSLVGKERLVARMPGTLMLLDIWKDGRLLLNRASWRRELTAVADGSVVF